MARNVLLMLSSAQPPDPVDEIDWHVSTCKNATCTWVVTTRILTGLNPGKSHVAFYGDNLLGNVLLGIGTYLDYVTIDSPTGKSIGQSSALYSQHGVPDNAKGFIKVSDLQRAVHGAQVDSLNAIIDSSGKINGYALTIQNLPNSASRAQIYFHY